MNAAIDASCSMPRATLSSSGRVWLLALALGFVAGHASASGIDQLKIFLDGAKNGSTTFRQTVLSKSGRAPKESSGSFAFSRPGKFRWSYDKPYAQLIVGDGDKLWIYDRDLNQVIVKKIDSALGATPAALLAGGDALEKNFELSEDGYDDGVDFVSAKPKTSDSGFESVRIGMKGNQPRAMELHDSFGQVTRLTFGGFDRGATLDPALFRFVPPQGADVVGE